jgi:hypothetical protein
MAETRKPRTKEQAVRLAVYQAMLSGKTVGTQCVPIYASPNDLADQIIAEIRAHVGVF